MKLKFKIIIGMTAIAVMPMLILLCPYRIAGGKTIVFFRVDDLFRITSSVTGLHRLFMEQGVPVNYEVIPSKIEPEFTAWLVAQKKERPGLIGIDQHGYTHEKHGCPEFGECRDYSQQYQDILQGKRIMESHFGDLFSYVFSPPHNTYRPATLKALEDNGFRILSASVSKKNKQVIRCNIGQLMGVNRFLDWKISYNGKKIANYELEEYSVCVDTLKKDDSGKTGAYRIKSLDEMIDDYNECKSRYKVVGIMLHDWACSSDDLDVIRALVEYIKGQPDIEIKRIEELYSGHSQR